ncbi:MAG: prolipoprotein diacylglyceryl transferase [Patescibacteria group bacterium]
MLNFLHTFHPDPVLASFAGITVNWYGFFIVTGIILAILTAIKLGSYYKIDKDTVFDLSFWLLISGMIGARLYHVFLEFPYYIENPEQTIKLWQGGLAIHGGLIAGILVLYIFTRKKKINFWKMGAILAPGIALAQAVGRWGNYFNQELFGKPTDLPWGIPIEATHRPMEYISSQYFHPTFLYESLGNLIIFLILINLHIYLIKKNNIKNLYFFIIIMLYLILYSILRFTTEIIRIDETPLILGLRAPQVASIVIISIAVILLITPLIKKRILTSKEE